MLRAIFFDIDDTLYSTTEFARQARAAAIGAMISVGLKVDRDACVKELEEVIGEFSSNYAYHFDKLLARLGPTALGDANPAVVIAAAVAAYHGTKTEALVPFPGVLPLFEKLSETDVILGVVTEGLAVKQAEKLLRLGLLPHLTPGAIFISDQIGISKPNPKLYQRALDGVGAAPGEAMYVGNRATHDVDPPASLGMKTVLIDHGGKHAGIMGVARPDYMIKRFDQLADILANDFGVPLH